MGDSILSCPLPARFFLLRGSQTLLPAQIRPSIVRQTPLLQSQCGLATPPSQCRCPTRLRPCTCLSSSARAAPFARMARVSAFSATAARTALRDSRRPRRSVPRAHPQRTSPKPAPSPHAAQAPACRAPLAAPHLPRAAPFARSARPTRSARPAPRTARRAREALRRSLAQPSVSPQSLATLRRSHQARPLFSASFPSLRATRHRTTCCA